MVERPLAGLQPYFDRQADRFGFGVFVEEAHLQGEAHIAVIFQFDPPLQLTVLFDLLDRADREVHPIGIVEPAHPEPTQVFPGGVVEAGEQVARLRVPVGPFPNERLKGIVEALGAQNVLPKQHHTHGRLEIVGVVVSGAVVMVGIGARVAHRRVDQALEHRRVVADVRTVFSFVEILGRVVAHEGGQAFVDPAIAPLVGTHDHRKPAVRDFVVGSAPQGFPSPRRRHEGQTGIFDPPHSAGHADHFGEGVFVPHPGVEFERTLQVLGRPAKGSFSGAGRRVD